MHDDKVIKILESLVTGQSSLQAGQNRIEKQLDKVKQGQAHSETALEALKAGQDDIRDKMATGEEVMNLGAKVDRITKNHERRIEEIEEHAGLKNPFKN